MGLRGLGVVMWEYKVRIGEKIVGELDWMPGRKRKKKMRDWNDVLDGTMMGWLPMGECHRPQVRRDWERQRRYQRCTEGTDFRSEKNKVSKQAEWDEMSRDGALKKRVKSSGKRGQEGVLVRWSAWPQWSTKSNADCRVVGRRRKRTKNSVDWAKAPRKMIDKLRCGFTIQTGGIYWDDKCGWFFNRMLLRAKRLFRKVPNWSAFLTRPCHHRYIILRTLTLLPTRLPTPSWLDFLSTWGFPTPPLLQFIYWPHLNTPQLNNNNIGK